MTPFRPWPCEIKLRKHLRPMSHIATGTGGSPPLSSRSRRTLYPTSRGPPNRGGALYESQQPLASSRHIRIRVSRNKQNLPQRKGGGKRGEERGKGGEGATAKPFPPSRGPHSPQNKTGRIQNRPNLSRHFHKNFYTFSLRWVFNLPGAPPPAARVVQRVPRTPQRIHS